MFKHPCLLLLFLITTLTASIAQSASTNTIDALATLCQDRTIILLGEPHHEPNSQILFLDLVWHYAEQDDRVYVGLEIPSDKQIKLDDALTGGSDFSFISPIILHDQYKEMIHALGGMEGDVTVQAIDAGEVEPVRDAAMSRNILSALSSGKYDKILALVGNVHVIKNIQWDKDITSTGKYLAEHLLEAGLNPCSVQQLFRVKRGAPVLVRTDTKEGALLALEVIYPVDHSNNMEGSDVCDAVVEWK
ncbi:MAG: hypothetical protein ACI8PB_005358 [Desulforhopalus sp.]|jgi:hypothetical protein